jgi:hypothetical protein
MGHSVSQVLQRGSEEAGNVRHQTFLTAVPAEVDPEFSFQPDGRDARPPFENSQKSVDFASCSGTIITVAGDNYHGRNQGEGFK